MIRDTIYADSSLLSLYQAENDADLLTALNADTTKVLTKQKSQQVPGFISVATMGDILGEAPLAAFQLAIRGTIDSYKTAASSESDPAAKATLLGTVENLEGFLSRFRNSADGINMADDSIRGNVSAILTAAGIDPAPYLALGCTFTTPALAAIGRDATQADIDAVRWRDVWESQSEQIDMAKNEYLAGAKSAAVLRMQAVVAQLDA